MKGPLDYLFSLGDKVTKGDPKRQADFTYYMLWILFLAFTYMFLLNGYRLITTWDTNYVIWTGVGFAIMGLQFFNLKTQYEMKKLRDNPKQKTPEKVETIKEMMEGFNNDKKDNKRIKSKQKIQPKK